MSQMFKKFKGAGVDVQVKKETKIFLKASVMCIQKPIALQALLYFKFTTVCTSCIPLLQRVLY